MTESFLRLPAVQQRTGLGRSSIYSRMAAGEFPKPIAIGARAVAWQESAVNAWIEARVSAAKSHQAAAEA